MKSRPASSRDIRVAAAELAYQRPHPTHLSNGDERRWRRRDCVKIKSECPETADTKSDDPKCEGKDKTCKWVDAPSFVGNFTKGMPHDQDGFLDASADYMAWVRAVDSGDERDIAAVPLGPVPAQPKWKHSYGSADKCPKGVRGWESQGAGLTYDLEGPDAQAVTMPPAPALDSQELIAEMAEVYWMALCRDVAFVDWGDTDPKNPIGLASKSLAKLAWFREDGEPKLRGSTDGLASSRARRRVLVCGDDQVPLNQLFRGVGPGVTVGPYVSQFMLIGNEGAAGELLPAELKGGFIAYGAIRADQRVRVAEPVNYMESWAEWLDVQNGADVKHNIRLLKTCEPQDSHRFICCPRDLATYVHDDALYEAYLNACLILLGMKAPFDPGMPFLDADTIDKQQGFAQFGGPHILTLVTEVATRALKAVRYQKFNVHRRLRPEAVGGWLERLAQGPVDPTKLSEDELKARLAPLVTMQTCLTDIGLGPSVTPLTNWLLPMAFAEGSPMHPSYGAGHAAVAGACVTLLKAWFDHGWVLQDGDGKAFAYQASADGKQLDPYQLKDEVLTVEGELNKLAANISVGRNWAGVHYYSDYIESYRLGEQVALGLLEEQKLSYGENFSVTVPLLDGTTRRI